MIDKIIISEAIKLWHDFQYEILYKNRYFTRHRVLEIVEEIANFNTVIIDRKTQLFRARIFDEDIDFLMKLESEEKIEDTVEEKVDRLRAAIMRNTINAEVKKREDTGFWGFDKEKSYVPKNKKSINDGRVNPKCISYLYTAFEEYTAMVEVRPYLKSYVSIAVIKPFEDLRIADFSLSSLGKGDELSLVIQFLVMDAFSKPVNNNVIEYIPTQYISEYIKSLGFDGIKFNSSLNKGGNNLTVFYPEKCEAISSKLVEIENIYFEGSELAPEKGHKLMNQYLKTLKLNSLPLQKK